MRNHWSEKIRRYLQSPYPVVYQRWKVVLISSLVVFLILLVLQPFGISGIEGHKFWILLGFMGVTAVFLSIPVYLFACLFPEFYKEEGWTVWKQIVNLLMVILFIAVGNWLYSTFVFGWGLRWDVFYSTFHFIESKQVVGYPFRGSDGDEPPFTAVGICDGIYRNN